MKIDYTKKGDYYVPNLVLTGTEKEITLGKYGRMRVRFLREQKNSEYIILLMEDKLQEHLLEIERTANIRLDLIIQQLAQKEGVTEELKASNQMEWVRCMNNIKNRAEEIVFDELIFI